MVIKIIIKNNIFVFNKIHNMYTQRQEELQTMQNLTRNLAERISNQRRLTLSSEDIPALQRLINTLNEAFPKEDYPRDDSPPLTRSLSGMPGTWDTALVFGIPDTMKRDCLLGWALLLTGRHPETIREIRSLERCCDLFVETYTQTEGIYRDRHLRFLWHLIAE